MASDQSASGPTAETIKTAVKAQLSRITESQREFAKLKVGDEIEDGRK